MEDLREGEVISQVALRISAPLPLLRLWGIGSPFSSDFYVPQRCPVPLWMNGALGYWAGQMPVSSSQPPLGMPLRGGPAPSLLVLHTVLAPSTPDPQLLGVGEAESG